MTLACSSRSSLPVLFLALAAGACSSSSKRNNADAQPDVNASTDASVVSLPDSAGLDASSESQGEVGQASRLTVSPPSIDLGIVQPDVATSRQTITVTATSDIADLSVLVLGNDLTLDGISTCAKTLAAGSSCLVVVTFLSSTTGTKSDSIAIVADGQSTGVPVTAKVQTGPHLTIVPTAGSIQSTPLMLNVGNSGDTGVGPLTVTLTGPNAADFTATATGCDFLAPSGFCTISVVFTQAASVPNCGESATLVATGPAPDFATVSAALYGGPSGSPGPLLLSSTTSDLGSAAVGATSPSVTFTLANIGSCTGPLGPFTVALSNAEFVVTEETCSTSVLPLGGTCTVSVALRPSSAGAKSAFLSVTAASGKYAGANLTGAGLSVVDAGSVEPVDSGREQGEAGSTTLGGSSG